MAPASRLLRPAQCEQGIERPSGIGLHPALALPEELTRPRAGPRRAVVVDDPLVVAEGCIHVPSLRPVGPQVTDSWGEHSIPSRVRAGMPLHPV